MHPKTIAEQLFFTTVQIVTVDNGNQNSGTGFFFIHKIDNDKEFPVIVTNKHVVMNAHEFRFSFLKQKNGNPSLGDGFNLTIIQEDAFSMWFGHPNKDIDIAICPLAPLVDIAKQQHGVDLFFRAVDTSMIPTQQQIAELDAIEPVTFIGYPDGIWDDKNLLPIARRGTTATPIMIDFRREPKFLIDASVFGGSSGSPVFIFDNGPFTTKDGNMVIGSSRFYFVGVIAQVFFRTQLNDIVPVPIPTQMQTMAQQKEMIDLGIVFKAHTVVETIEAYLNSHNINTP